jgi:hypothetical protein
LGPIYLGVFWLGGGQGMGMKKGWRTGGVWWKDKCEPERESRWNLDEVMGFIPCIVSANSSFVFATHHIYLFLSNLIVYYLSSSPFLLSPSSFTGLFIF